MAKTLEERNCKVYFQWNEIIKAWNGYLYKVEKKLPTRNGVPNHIKCFVRSSKEECLLAATEWANDNPQSLINYKDK